MAELIPITPKTTYEFDGRANSTQTIALRERLPAVAFGSGVLVVRVHDIGTWTSTASATIAVLAQSWSPEDPGTQFIDPTQLASAVINYNDSTPELIIGTTGASATSFDVNAPMLLVQLQFAQGATAASAVETLTIAVDLVLRETK